MKHIFHNTELDDSPDQKYRSPRADYLLEKARIIEEIGNLEEIRRKLGLSQRKVCKLLLVDPSAWTRWNKTPEGAPPHIYQALRWLIELQKVNPEAAAPMNIVNKVDFIHSSTESRFKEVENTLALLERSVGLMATAQPVAAPTPPRDESLAEEIATLKAQIALLLENQKKKSKAAPAVKKLKRSNNPKKNKKNKKTKIRAKAKVKSKPTSKAKTAKSKPRPAHKNKKRMPTRRRS